MPWLTDGFGNPSSIHSLGLAARGAVEQARAQVALAVEADDPSLVVFTSGATESLNTVLRAKSSGIVSPFEHSAVRETAEILGFVTMDWDDEQLLGDRGYDVSALTRVCNETGRTFSREDGDGFGASFLSDMTQALGKVPVTMDGADYAAFSAHKIFGPKGVGALVYGDFDFLSPLLTGGGQEEGRRAGTLNVPGIVGFGRASELAVEEFEPHSLHAIALRGILLEGLDGVSDVRVNGGDEAAPHILSLSLLGLEGETLVLEADAAGFAISAGAACSSGSTEPSRVLLAEGLTPEWARGTIRVSFGPGNTKESAQELAKILRRSAQSLRTMMKVA